jgi:hypothetical protein
MKGRATWLDSNIACDVDGAHESPPTPSIRRASNGSGRVAVAWEVPTAASETPETHLKNAAARPSRRPSMGFGSRLIARAFGSDVATARFDFNPKA